MLTNVTYVGKLRYRDEVHHGEHVAIVDEDVFERVQKLLHDNGRGTCGDKRNKHGALLRGILRCASCNCGMTHTYTAKDQRRYRYYVCNNAQQNGRAACPAPSVPAGQIEAFVVEEIKAIGRDPALVAATVAESQRLIQQSIKRLKAERAALERQRRADTAELGRARQVADGEATRLTELRERNDLAEHRLLEIEAELDERIALDITEEYVATALRQFDDLWATLKPSEQARVLTLLVESLSYEGKAGELAITFRSNGFNSLAGSEATCEETAA
jgi:site-specific DNA recombinase